MAGSERLQDDNAYTSISIRWWVWQVIMSLMLGSPPEPGWRKGSLLLVLGSLTRQERE